ncbi:ABC transporter ATP-binding protein [Cellulomonas sp. HZM]|uniref:ATP-binding cassette domain-containing protein n=1 Tax=Cellulomonas sp. HZM TaxID=1454010 RepID=UPI0018CC191B|nr:ATP-binding cassette domain-containing protein [Cellulomonas sp. HZM]
MTDPAEIAAPSVDDAPDEPWAGDRTEGPAVEDDAAVGEQDEPDEPDEPDDVASAPVVVARGLGLRLRTGWVFRHVDLDVDPGESVELVGSGGTGRSMLLLALVGRARFTAGSLRVLGAELSHARAGAGAARSVRARTSVARVLPQVEPQEWLTVGESARERSRWERGRPTDGNGAPLAFDEAARLVGLDAPRSTMVEHLGRLDQVRLALALALLAPHEVLVVDDLDRGLRADELRAAGETLAAIAATGVAVLATTSRESGSATRVVELPRTPAEHVRDAS